MVIRGHYVGLPVEDLETARTQLLEALQSARQGNRFSEVDMGGRMGKKSLLTYNEIVHELQEVLYALKKLQPDIYGKAIKRLVPNFNKPHNEIKIPFIQVKNAGKLTGGLVQDQNFNYSHERSLLTMERGFYGASDGSAEVARNGNGLWGLYGIAGYRYDYQLAFSTSPLTQSSAWDRIIVEL
jgi:hypothetical protein